MLVLLVFVMFLGALAAFTRTVASRERAGTGPSRTGGASMGLSGWLRSFDAAAVVRRIRPHARAARDDLADLLAEMGKAARRFMATLRAIARAAHDHVAAFTAARAERAQTRRSSVDTSARSTRRTFNRSRFQTAPLALRPVSAEPRWSRLAATLELVLLILFAASLVAGAAFLGGHALVHAFSHFRTGG